MSIKRALLCLLLPAAAVSSACAAGDPLWDKMTSAKRVFQQGFYDIGSGRWPELEPLFGLERELQSAYLDRRSIVYRHKLKTAPQTIDLGHGLEGFMNFGWSKTADRYYRKAIPEYRRISRAIRSTELRILHHPRRADFLKAFSWMEVLPEYLDLMQGLNRDLSGARQLLRLRRVETEIASKAATRGPQSWADEKPGPR